MKKVILIFALAAFAFTAKAQTTAVTIGATANPYELNPDNTGVITITFAIRQKKDVVIYLPETNAGTVKVSTGTVGGTSPAWPANKYVILDDIMETLTIQFSNAADVAWISW